MFELMGIFVPFCSCSGDGVVSLSIYPWVGFAIRGSSQKKWKARGWQNGPTHSRMTAVL
jgi:hypothetical protein